MIRETPGQTALYLETALKQVSPVTDSRGFLLEIVLLKWSQRPGGLLQVQESNFQELQARYHSTDGPPKTQGNPPTNMSLSSEVLVSRERGQTAQRPMGIKWEKSRHRQNIIYSEGKWEENRHLPWSQAALQTESEFQVSTQFRFRSLNEGESTVLNVGFLTLGRRALTAEALLWFTESQSSGRQRAR